MTRPWRAGAALACGLVLACDADSAALQAPSPSPSAPAVELQLETDAGRVRCELFPERTPRAVALVAALAEGSAPFRDARDGRVRRGRYYDGLPFFRRIAGVMVQTGCRRGDGTGHPGYRIAAELHEDDGRLLAEPGALVMARYRPAPNRPDPTPPAPGETIGSQLGITLRPMPQLAGESPVIGRCEDLEVVQQLARAARRPRLTRMQVTRRQTGP